MADSVAQIMDKVKASKGAPELAPAPTPETEPAKVPASILSLLTPDQTFALKDKWAGLDKELRRATVLQFPAISDEVALYALSQLVKDANAYISAEKLAKAVTGISRYAESLASDVATIREYAESQIAPLADTLGDSALRATAATRTMKKLDCSYSRKAIIAPRLETVMGLTPGTLDPRE